jgi:sulfate permease, SulP family
MQLQKSGFSGNQLVANLALGIVDGLDSALWCYAFSAIIFTHLLSPFLPLGLIILLGGWAALSTIIALTSKAPVHMANIDEQAVVIIGAIAGLMMDSMGEAAASPRGLSTILVIMSLVSLTVSLGFFLCARFQLARLLELLPYPVICGFMAGIAWLLLDAGVSVALDASISVNLPTILSQGNHLERFLVCVAGGLFLCLFTARVEKAWSLPAASTAIVIAFFLSALLTGTDYASLRANGWMFNVQLPQQGIGGLLASLSFADIDVEFIISVIPQILTVVFLTMLAASMNLSAMTTLNVSANMDSADEMQGLSAGNLVCGLIASPPGFTDAPASILYRGFGATTRWMPLASSCVCLAVAFGGDWLVSYTPKVVIASTIFLFAFQLFYDWMYANVRSFNALDYAIVCCILITVIALGFMQGILIGIILTVLIFVLRYSLINPIQNRYTLGEHRSSVERSADSNLILNRHGAEVVVFTLRGFLFFGTANTIRDSIREQIDSGSHRSVLIDLHRVTGIDISATNILVQIRQICEAQQVELYYVCDVDDIRNKLLELEAVLVEDDGGNIYADTDTALEQLEESILAIHSDQTVTGSIRDYLAQLIGQPEQIKTLLVCLERKTFACGEYLFRQGDVDDGLYVIESGSMSAIIELPDQPARRLKKFIPGALVGELSAYTDEKTRTASVIANSSTVVYHLDPERLTDKAILHELIARVIGIRIDYMNRRLLREMI